MNKYAMQWCDTALRLEDELRMAYVLRDELAEENREIRDLIARIAFEVSSRHDLELIELAQAEIEARWPHEEAA